MKVELVEMEVEIEIETEIEIDVKMQLEMKVEMEVKMEFEMKQKERAGGPARAPAPLPPQGGRSGLRLLPPALFSFHFDLHFELILCINHCETPLISSSVKRP